MARSKPGYVCARCGALSAKWAGRCAECGEWDSLAPEQIPARSAADPRRAALLAFEHAANQNPTEASPERPRGPIGVDEALAGDTGDGAGRAGSAGEGEERGVGGPTRLATRIAELDRVLGGGFVRGSAVLVGGDPGIGKSTLMLQAAGALAARGIPTLYVSSEESAQQVALRAQRLGLAGRRDGTDMLATDPSEREARSGERGSASGAMGVGGRGGGGGGPLLLAESELTRIAHAAASCCERTAAKSAPPGVLFVDSIQLIYDQRADAWPGSILQLKRCCTELVSLAKAKGLTVVLVGHVTKDGSLAGPRLVEHLVDAVLYFEGDRSHSCRVVRSIKNRFGTTLEVGLFEMTSAGLVQAHHPGAHPALADEPRPGCVVCPVLTGTRTILVETQALTATGFFGAAKRKSSGLDASRLAMIIAVLEQHAGLHLADRDVFASAVGGVRVIEPAADLAVLLAVAGAHFRKALPPRTAAVGEVGLTGEVRPVPQVEQRVLEAARMGFTTILVPAPPRGRGGTHDTPAAAIGAGAPAGVRIVPVRSIEQAIAELVPVNPTAASSGPVVTTSGRTNVPRTGLGSARPPR